ncbi:DUF1552 domain-containing protein [Blastopirellula retiformator]|uniref:DUF1552 domain-containing protein n=1 Tax=Blastopirellula retiformator TaxID=2527970 RepID=A0A5C5V0P5_9BACT|nr:DUF1552 domain-containing protein [Blastopirellula retiformator]TWT32008.1 hypothetical protein Enr8_39340 [Blastopirellula retiformator]
MSRLTRREFVRNMGVSSAALPLLMNLPSLGMAAASDLRKQRMIVMFSPNGIIPDAYWPDQKGADFQLKEIMKPLEPYKNQTMVIKGVSDRVRGDGDSHMRGMSCLLTGIELFPGNIQGGSHTPAGWASGLSIDQEIKRYLQAQEATRTRFGSLEFGVNVPDRANPWTRMVYAGPNKPVAPIDDPYRMFEKLYGQVKDRESLQSVLDKVRLDLKRVERFVSSEDKQRLEEHAAFVRQMEQELKSAGEEKLALEAPVQEAGVQLKNDNMPTISKMQMDLLVNSLANDMARVATLQYTNSVGVARMKWLGVDDSHHELSHKPDSDADAKEKLIKINTWFCEQLAYLVKKLDETPEPDGNGSMLDNTTVIWTNELGKGNSHTLDDVPLVLVGGGLGFKMGQSIQVKKQPHNRLWLSCAHAFGHHLETFGNPDFCGSGALAGLT